jgi:VWFA-related protein
MDWRHSGFFIAFGSVLVGQAPTGPSFRATTKLVQVSLVAHDSKGAPVADLRREEFQILDNGVPQEIRVFVAETEKSSASLPQNLAPNTFTNRIAGSSTRNSVILFDNLLTGFGDPDTLDGTGFGVRKVLEALRNIPEGERIAIYALGRKLQVIREFTTDRESLERQLRAWRPSPDDAVTGTALCVPAPAIPARPGTEGVVLQGQAEMVQSCIRIDSLQRAAPFDAELKQIADHLAGIPGRKKLIWMANQFPITPSQMQRLTNAGVALYPVNEAGVKANARNDLDAVVLEAIEDGRASYTLGFYQPVPDSPRAGRATPPEVHQLAVHVSRPGVTLSYRATYLNEPPASEPSSQDLIDALNRSVDATAIAITASVARARKSIKLTEAIDLAGLDLDLTEGTWKGKAEVVTRFMAVDGTQAGEVVSDTLTLNLRPATYQSMLGTGVLYRKELTIPERAIELKLLVGNLASGKIGTLTIPLPDTK